MKRISLALFTLLFAAMQGHAQCSAVADFEYSVDSLTVVFDNTTTGTATSYTWLIDGEQINEHSPTYTFQSGGSYTVQLIAVGSNGNNPCFDDTAKDIVLLGDSTSTCETEAAFTYTIDDLTISTVNTSTNDVVSSVWQFDGEQVFGSAPTYTFETYGEHVVCLGVQSNNCFDSTCQNVSVTAPIPCDVVAAIESDYDGAAYFHNNSTGSIDSAYWYVNGNVVTDDVLILQGEPGDVVSACLIVVGLADNCMTEACDEVEIPQPSCDLTAAFEHVLTSDSLIVEDLSTGDIAESIIYVNQKSYPMQQRVSLALTPGTEYLVCVEAFGNDSTCFDSRCTSIVGPAATCNVVPSIETGIDGLIYFHNASTGSIDSSYWLVGNETVLDETLVLDGEPGEVISACLVVVGYADNCVKEACAEKQVPCEVAAKFELFHEGDITYVENLTTGAVNSELNWVIDGADPVYGELSELGLDTGWHSICLTAWAPNNCQDEFCKQFYVQSVAPDSCEVYVDFDYQIEGTVGVFERVANANTTNYSWKVDGDWVSEAVFLQKNFTPGSHEVCLKGYSTDSQCWDIVCKNIEIEQSVEDSCNLYVDFEYEDFGDGSFVFERIADAGVHEYQWNIDNKAPVYGAIDQVVLSPGDHIVCLKGYDLNDDLCYDQVCKQITVADPTDPECSLTADFEYIVDGMTVYFTNQSYGDTDPILAYEWTILEQTLTSKNPVYTFTKAGEYTVCLTSIETETCAADICKTIVIQDPVNVCELVANFSIEENDSAYVYTSTSTGNGVELWFVQTEGSNETMTSEEEVLTVSKELYGQHSICLITETADCFDEKCGKLQIVENPNCDLAAVFNTQKMGESTIATATKTDEATIIYWSFSAPYPTIDMLHQGDVFEFNNETPGEYYLCMYAQNGDCEETQCETFFTKQTAEPDCDLNAQIELDESIENELIFTATASQTDLEYKWFVSNASGTSNSVPSSGTNLVLDVTEGGVFEVCLLVTQGDSCEVEICQTHVIDEPCFVEAQYDFDVNNGLGHFEAASISNRDLTHQWVVNGVEHNGNTLTQPFDSSGTYEVCLHSWTTNEECIDEVCKQIEINLENPDSLLRLSGTVSNTSSLNGDAVLILYWMFDQGELIPLDTFKTDNGLYNFGVVEGVYVVRSTFEVEADLVNTLLPTYYGGNWSWNDATSIVVMGNSDNNDFALIDIAQNVLNGSATISGFIFAEDVPKTGATSGDPLPHELVILLNSSSEPVASTYTDDQGYYEFTGVPAGEYQVFVDKVGAIPTPYELIIGESDQLVGDINFVEATPIVATGTTTIADNVAIEVYPNPAINAVTINGTNIVTVLISNALGQNVVQHNSAPTNQVVLDVSDLRPGAYLIRTISSSEVQFTQHLMKE